MKQFFTKISSFILAFLVFFSTLSFTVEKHFCGGFLVDISYFGNSQGCAGEGEEDCDNPEVIAKKNCCKDEIQQIKGQDKLQKSSVEKITLQKVQFLLAFVTSYNNLFAISQKQIVPNQHYFPPEVVDDLQVLHEVFII